MTFRPSLSVGMLKRTCSRCGNREPVEMGSKVKPRFVCAKCNRLGKRSN